MALSLSNYLICCVFAFLLHLHASLADTVNIELNVTWVRANPDGQFERSVIGVNGQWPLPIINVTRGDRLVAKVNNHLGNQTTSFHWHGIYQNGTTNMDGAVQVSQCRIPIGGSMTYNFTIDQPGTYWYHSHNRGQYPDGQRGALIVHDPKNPFDYDEEIVLTISDWYHMQMPDLLDKFISVTNPTGAEPVPQSALMNDTQNQQIKIEPGKTYMLRIINMAAFAAQYFWIEDHTMKIIEVDGIYTKPAEASQLYITAAQRYTVLLTTKKDTSKNYAIVGSMDEDLFDQVPAGLNPNVTSFLVYDDSKDMPKPANINAFEPFDDYTLEPYDELPLLENPEKSITLNMAMGNLGDGANYAFFNDVTYVRPKVPTLMTALTTGDAAMNETVYGPNTNAFILKKGEVVEIILNNMDPGKHPFHLHGHNFQLAFRSEDEAGLFDPKAKTVYKKTPMRRDTVLVHPDGNMVLRFVADNPGIWLFHCHLEWHLASGLVATMVEAPLDLQKSLQLPEEQLQICRDTDTPYRGNAAGNTEDVYDLSGANTSPAPLPSGFTARGIVALVFSCIAAFLGLAVISWYGAAPISNSEFSAAQRRIAEAEL